MTAQCNSRRRLTLQDVIKFPWEVDVRDEEQTKVTDADVKRLKAMAQDYLSNENNSVKKF